MSKNSRKSVLECHVSEVKQCRACSRMVGPVVCAEAVISPILVVGQAPGAKEGEYGKPFAWTAGKTLFRWFERIGLKEDNLRKKVFIGAVCKCFPGKNPKGGDRVPEPDEIENCRYWLEREIEILQPSLVISVGKLAASQFVDFEKLAEIVGTSFRVERNGVNFDLICLPHPSGASTWHRMSPGKDLLDKALKLIAGHKVWQTVCKEAMID